MTISIEVSDHDDHLMMTLEGDLPLTDPDALAELLAERCAHSDAPVILIDISNFSIRANPGAMYQLAVSKQKHCTHLSRPIALVGQRAQWAEDYALMASNRGSAVHLFDDMGPARSWASSYAQQHQ